MKVSVPVTLSSERKSRTKAPFANLDQPRSNSLGAGALPDAVDDLDCRGMSINMLPAPYKFWLTEGVDEIVKGR